MLHIIFGNIDDFNERYGTDYKVLRNIDLHFDSDYKVEWLQDEFARKVIKEVDKSEYREGHIIDSPYLGPIPPVWLSGGVKTLISMKSKNMYNGKPLIFYGNNMGDNCAEHLAELSSMTIIEDENLSKDIWMNINYYMQFPLTDDKVDVVFEGINLKVTTTSKDLDEAMVDVYCEWLTYMENLIQKEEDEIRARAEQEGWIFEEVDEYGFRGKLRGRYD